MMDYTKEYGFTILIRRGRKEVNSTIYISRLVYMRINFMNIYVVIVGSDDRLQKWHFGY